MKCKNCNTVMNNSQIYQGIEVNVPFCIVCNNGSLNIHSNSLTPSAWLIPQIQAQRERAINLAEDMKLHTSEIDVFIENRAKQATKIVASCLEKMGFPLMEENPTVKDGRCHVRPYDVFWADEVKVSCDLVKLFFTLDWRGVETRFVLSDHVFNPLFDNEEVDTFYTSDWKDQIQEYRKEWEIILKYSYKCMREKNVCIKWSGHYYDIFDPDTIIEMWDETVWALEQRKLRGEL